MVPFGLIRAILVSPLEVFGLKWSITRAFAVLFKQDKDLRHCFHNHDEWNVFEAIVFSMLLLKIISVTFCCFRIETS